MPQFLSFVCGVCRKSFKSMPTLRRHKCVRPPECDRCGEVLRGKTEMVTHIQTHTDKDREEREKQKEQIRKMNKAAKRMKTVRKGEKKPKVKAAKRMRTTQERCKCDDCFSEFKSRTGLVYHVTRGSCTCGYCQETFADPCRLFRHKLIEHNTSNVTCDHCSMQFKRKHHVQRHIRETHLKIHRYRCQECGAAFYRASSCVMHMQSLHWRTQGFQCDDCPRMSWSQKAIQYHVRQCRGKKTR